MCYDFQCLLLPRFTGVIWFRYEQVKALKEGKSVQKPIYNHVSGLLDAPEETTAPKVSLPSPPSGRIVVTCAT